MINELYIDNFRCLVNFRISLVPNQLWLGDNGMGKTSVLDSLVMIQRVVRGDNVEDVFSIDDLTFWQEKSEQTFAFKMTVGDATYDYRLVIQHDRPQRQCRILSEEMKWNDSVFYRFDGGNAHLYRINRHTQKPEEGTKFSADWGRSVISTIAKRDDNLPLVQFREEVGKWLIVHPIPVMVEQLAQGETRQLSRYAGNFAQWYRHLLQESPDIIHLAGEMLKDVLPGFQMLSLKEIGDSRRLTAVFRIMNQDHNVPFDKLSDGQRQLVVLYVLLKSLKRAYTVMIIDEPDNFTSLREIQPWLLELHDICSEGSCQAILISHHPEIINEMARGSETWFHRPNLSHTVTGPYPVCEGLTPAETMARGWDDE